MSTKYKNSRDVPTESLIDRLEKLSDAVTCGPEGLGREFTMRIPAECDRDADLVLAESARRLRTADTALAAAEARIAELEGYNVGLATESHQQQKRIASLENALERIKARCDAYVDADAPMNPDSSVQVISDICAAELLKEKE